MASFNPERAEVPLTLPDGRTLKLVLDYQTVGAMIAKLGDKWDTALGDGFTAYDCPKICDALEILAARHHPEMTAAEFMTASPAWTDVMNATQALQTLFLFGHVGPPPREPKEEGDPEDGEEVPFANGQDGGDPPRGYGRGFFGGSTASGVLGHDRARAGHLRSVVARQ